MATAVDAMPPAVGVLAKPTVVIRAAAAQKIQHIAGRLAPLTWVSRAVGPCDISTSPLFSATWADLRFASRVHAKDRDFAQLIRGRVGPDDTPLRRPTIDATKALIHDGRTMSDVPYP